MSLSEFLKILYRYYGNDGLTADFVRGLFSAAVDMGANTELFPDDSVPQKLYNGNSHITKPLAKKMSPCLNRDQFIDYLDNLTTDSIANLNAELGFPDIDDPGDMTIVYDELFAGIYDVFISYVKNAGKNYIWSGISKGQLTLDDYGSETSAELSVMGLPRLPSDANTVLSLLMETSGKCPLCKKPLLRDKNGIGVGGYLITDIYPADIVAETADELAGVEKLSVDLTSAYNKIALCIDCALKYKTKTTKDEYNSLATLKKELLKYSSAREKVDDAKIEQEIEEVVRRLANANPDEYADLSYDAVSVAEKIHKSNAMFFQKVFINVVEYFNCISEIFGQLSAESRLNFEEVASEIRLAFFKADKDELTQEQIFEVLVDKIRGGNRALTVSACEAVVAFFVQDCEVFNVIAK